MSPENKDTPKEVLLIDDVADVRMHCRKVIQKLGMSVVEAGSVDQALDIISKRAPNLIILDLQMPKKNGFDFLGARADDPKIKAIPVIILTSVGDKASALRAIAMGANDYVVKPLNAPIFLNRVRKHIRGSEFKRYSFPAGKVPKVTLRVTAKILRIQEASINLESPVRLEKGNQIYLSPPKIKTVDIAGCVLQVDNEPNHRGISGQYMARINVIGLSETIQKKLEKKPTP